MALRARGDVKEVVLRALQRPKRTREIGAGSPESASAPGDSFTMALAGDSIITRKLSIHRQPEFLALIELVRGADVAFTNLEVLFHDYEPYPMSQGGGPSATYMRADPVLVHELVWAGFDLVSRANNHAGDYGVPGMRLTTEYLKKAGLGQAGVGESLAEAREAKFLDTTKARVALVSVASTFPDHIRAGKSRGDIPARPGLNPLRFSTRYVVTRGQFRKLYALATELDLLPPDPRLVSPTPLVPVTRGRGRNASLTVLGHEFVVGDTPGPRTTPLKEDLEEIAAVVRSASRLADHTIVSIHSHEGDGNNKFFPAQFLVAFARVMIDNGADVVVGQGPHVLRGIEIYRGKPILYSLGNFIFQNDTLLRLPHENYERYGLGPNSHVADFNDKRYDYDRRGFPVWRQTWESAVAVLRWDERVLSELLVYPITLGFGRPRTKRGWPMLAGPELGRTIIQNLVRLSAPFGTRIPFENGVGRVELAASGRARRPRATG